jgi:hypothetical protein
MCYCALDDDAGLPTERLMAEEVDIRFLGEQLKRLQTDVRQVKTDMAQIRADNVKVDGDVAALKASVAADLARVETKLEVFRESVDDRFEQTIELIKSNFRILSGRTDTVSDQLRVHSSQLDTILNEIRALKRS